MSQDRVVPHQFPSSFVGALIMVLAGTLVSATGARAAEWVERPFDPPVGSRWIIQSNDTTEDDRDGHTQTTVTTMTSEWTIEQKTADGFRVAYVVRNATYEGDARTAALVGPMTKALENVVVHGVTAPNGMPLRVENLAEVQAAAHTAIDNVTAALADKPQVAAVLRQLATRMLIADEKQAPTIYLASLATLPLGQNTGLHPGETRHTDDNVPSPFAGAPIKSNTTLRIDSADAATGNVRYIRTRAFDSDAIKEFLSRLAQQLGAKDGERLDDMMKQLAMTLDSRTEIDVEDGMTRAVREEDTITGGVPGHTIVKHAHKLLAVTRAP